MKPPLSGEAWTDWLKTMPPEKKYYFYGRNCSIYQYIYSLGVSQEDAFGAYEAIACDGFGEVAAQRPWTFGAVHARARALLAENS